MGQEATHSIQIIPLCARKDTRQMAMDAGAYAFLAKPFEMKGLLTLVATFLGNEQRLFLSVRRFLRASAAEQ